MTTAPAFEAAEAWATEEDRRDPLAWAREEFALPRDGNGAPLAYMSGNSLGLMPKVVPELIRAEDRKSTRLNSSHT